MNHKVILFLLVASVPICLHLAEAQQPTKIPRVAWLTTGPLSIISARLEAFRQGLRELGYVEGKNISIEARRADNIPERRKALVEELVRLKVDVIRDGR